MTVLSLEHLRVIDASQVMAGPYCALLLADLGAEVIKVEPPSGDATRGSLGDIQNWGESAAFLAVNRNKRSVAIDLKSALGLEVFRRLAAGVDVLVESYRPGTTKRLGIDYEALRDGNQGLVYASISGFGATGPYSAHGGYDIITQGMSGIMSVTGESGGEPAKAGVPLTDIGQECCAQSAFSPLSLPASGPGVVNSWTRACSKQGLSTEPGKQPSSGEQPAARPARIGPPDVCPVPGDPSCGRPSDAGGEHR